MKSRARPIEGHGTIRSGGPRVEFQPRLRSGKLIKRYKRFLADVETPHGPLTMHCANTGAMRGCSEPGSRVWFSTSDNERRKYRHSLELVQVRGEDGTDLVAVNTARANGLVAEALLAGLLPALPAGEPIRHEVPIPATPRQQEHANGRFDLLAGDTYIEVKSVTWQPRALSSAVGDVGRQLPRTGAFPDAVSVRARRHALALGELAAAGVATAFVFCVLHTSIDVVRPADEVDPEYGKALRWAAAQGVRVLALGCKMSVRGITPTGTLPVMLS